MITEKTFKQLSEIHKPHCVSIYIPTENKEKDKIRFKNHLQQLSDILENVYELGPKEIEEKEDRLWHALGTMQYQSQPNTGVAVFLYGDEVQKVDLKDMHVPDKLHVDDHLYLVPLAEAVQTDTGALLLQLSANRCVLYVHQNGALEKHAHSDRLPSNMNEVIGYDVEQKSLQSRQGQQGTEGGEQSGLYHGHGSGSETEQKEEYEKYFRGVDKALQEIVAREKRPLYVACVDYLFPMFQEVCTYHKLSANYLEGNYDEASLTELQAEVEAIMEKKDAKKVEQKRAQFQPMLSNQKASYQEKQIVKAAREGRIDTLLVDRNADLWGRFVQERAEVEIDAVHTVSNTSLINLAAIETIEHGGEVYLLEHEEMPAKEHTMNALFRYNHSPA